MIDRALIGRTLPECSIEVEKYPLRLFAGAIGTEDPLHRDEIVARAAGYRSLSCRERLLPLGISREILVCESVKPTCVNTKNDAK